MQTRALRGEVAIPAAANTALFTVVVAGNLVCGLAVPTILLPHSSAWLLLLVPLVGLSATHWALIHEAVHAHLHPSGAANEAGGRMLGILFGASFAVLRFGHLSHHSLNATPTERPELYDPRTSSRLRAAAVFYFRLFIGIYVAEFLSAPLSFLPRRMLRPMVRKVFYDGANDARGMPDRAERQLLEPFPPGQDQARQRPDACLARLVPMALRRLRLGLCACRSRPRRRHLASWTTLRTITARSATPARATTCRPRACWGR